MHSKRKCNALFDYARLKPAIPPVWVNSLKEEFMHDYTRQENENKVPYLLVANKVKHVTDMSSNRFYKLVPSRTHVAFIGEKNNLAIDWSTVFKRNLEHIRESKLREFNLKLLYNIMPVRSNLFDWGISKMPKM